MTNRIVVKQGEINRIIPNEARKEFAFVCRGTRVSIDSKSDTIPSILLINNESKIPVCYTGFEKYIFNLVDLELQAGTTLSKKGKAVCAFLNYILRETSLNNLESCALNDIRSFLEYRKKKSEHLEMEADSWRREKNTVLDFLRNYYEVNNKWLDFKCDMSKLQTISKLNGNEQYFRKKYFDNAGLSIKAPRGDLKRKNRLLMYGYLDLLLYEALKYDPDIVLGIALQAYAGLREGEVVNLTCGSYKEIYRNFNSLSAIELNLGRTAPFFQEWNKITPPGSIKVFRIQRVYDHFLNEVQYFYDEHIRRLELKGYDASEDTSLFRNAFGNPMTVQTYSNRVKSLFYKHFLPSLKKTCQESNSWSENTAYIEAYDNEYPGAHMFRHWFTMYLFVKAKLSPAEIMKWRGDTSQISMLTYLHENSDLIEAYRNATYSLQNKILEDIKNGRRI